jgi:hypothetical protein
MGVAFADTDVPFDSGRPADEALGLLEGEIGRQHKLASGQKPEELSQHDLGEEGSDDAAWEEDVGTAKSLPNSRGGHTAPGDETVKVRVKRQGTAPGVQRHDDPGKSAEVLGVSEEAEESVTGAAEEKIGHRLAVVSPQGQELVGEGEDHLVVIRGEEKLALSVQPLLELVQGALGAGSVTAGVVPDAVDMTVHADLRMPPECRGPASHECLARPMQIEREAMSPAVLRETCLEDVANRRSHIRERRNEVSWIFPIPTGEGNSREAGMFNDLGRWRGLHSLAAYLVISLAVLFP